MSGNSATVTAPSAPSGMEFSHWETNGYVLEDTTQKTVTVTVNDDNKGVTLTPTYVNSDVPNFRVNVVTGEGGDGQSNGSGWYSADDVVPVSAAAPKEGYIFTHWSNADQLGYGADIVMANEYYQSTTFTMVNRVQALPEDMFDKGDTLIFAGGCDEENTVAEATKKYSDQNGHSELKTISLIGKIISAFALRITAMQSKLALRILKAATHIPAIARITEFTFRILMPIMQAVRLMKS